MTRAWLPILLLSVAASAQEEADTVYRWTDSAGELHYTNDPQTIPERYRSKARKTEGTEVGEITTDPATRPRPSQGDAEARGAADPAAEEVRWRAAFQQAHAEIARLEAEIAQDRETARSTPMIFTATGRWPAPEAQAAEQRIIENEPRLKEARGHLEDLERRARHEGVPFEWRR